MKKKYLQQFSVLLIVVVLTLPQLVHAQKGIIENWHYNPDKELNPNTKWLRDAKWGLFTHFIGGGPTDKWNERVNAFDVKALADQLEELKAPYFFLTIGRQYFCAPNKTYERLLGPSNGKLSNRDLVADLAEELNSRGIKLCLYITAVGRNDSAEKQAMWREVIKEWSKRYGESVHAWWIDGATYDSPEVFKAYTAAFKSGNPKVILAYNPGAIGISRDQYLPVTEHEDYLAGECDFIFPTCGVRVFDGKEYYLGPNISGDQLHFLSFLGPWWSGRVKSKPRFSNDFIISWTKHINDFQGTVTWDLPVGTNGTFPANYFEQVKALSKAINETKN